MSKVISLDEFRAKKNKKTEIIGTIDLGPLSSFLEMCKRPPINLQAARTKLALSGIIRLTQ